MLLQGEKPKPQNLLQGIKTAWSPRHPFPPTLRSVRNSRSAQGNAWQKCDFAALYYTFLGAASRCRARLTRKNSHFPPALRSVRNSRPAQGALTEKCDFRWRELNFIWVQRYAACRNARRARSGIVVHFTRSFVAQRFKSAFHVFAKAKTFHFCAEDMLAYCDFVIVAPILITFMPNRRL